MKRNQIINWIAELFNESPEEIASETKREDIMEWDSIGTLNLMAELDQKFGIVLTNEDLDALNSVGDLIDLLGKYGKIDD